MYARWSVCVCVCEAILVSMCVQATHIYAGMTVYSPRFGPDLHSLFGRCVRKQEKSLC